MFEVLLPSHSSEYYGESRHDGSHISPIRTIYTRDPPEVAEPMDLHRCEWTRPWDQGSDFFSLMDW